MTCSRLADCSGRKGVDFVAAVVGAGSGKEAHRRFETAEALAAEEYSVDRTANFFAPDRLRGIKLSSSSPSRTQ